MRSLHIAYVGNFSLPWCTETHLARTLEQLGHKVTRLQEDAYGKGRLATTLERLPGLDMFLYTRTWGNTVRITDLDRLRAKGILSVSYHLDLYFGLKESVVAGRNRMDGIGDDPFWRTDYVFSPDGDPESEKYFSARRVNHRWMLPGVVKDECYLADTPLERDIIFVGSRTYHGEYPFRPKLLNWLEETYGDRFSWHGGHGVPVRGDDLNRLYASSRIVIGDSLILPGHTRYCSDRRYETPGRGGFLIQPRIEGIEDGSIDGVNTVFFSLGDLDDLKQKIDHYLSRDEERERIRRAGHEHTRDNNTYTNRLQQMFETLLREGALTA